MHRDQIMLEAHGRGLVPRRLMWVGGPDRTAQIPFVNACRGPPCHRAKITSTTRVERRQLDRKLTKETHDCLAIRR